MSLKMSDSLDRCVLTHSYISGINRTGTELFNEPVYTPWLWYSCFRCLDYTGQDYRGDIMYKTINKMVPDYLSSKFTPTSHSDSKLFVPARPLTACVSYV